MIRTVLLCLLGLLWIPSDASAQACVGNPVTVQILGSGGPAINADRASAGYLLWIGDRPKILVDTGGGAFLRFGQAQGNTGGGVRLDVGVVDVTKAARTQSLSTSRAGRTC